MSRIRIIIMSVFMILIMGACTPCQIQLWMDAHAVPASDTNMVDESTTTTSTTDVVYHIPEYGCWPNPYPC